MNEKTLVVLLVHSTDILEPDMKDRNTPQVMTTYRLSVMELTAVAPSFLNFEKEI